MCSCMCSCVCVCVCVCVCTLCVCGLHRLNQAHIFLSHVTVNCFDSILGSINIIVLLYLSDIDCRGYLQSYTALLSSVCDIGGVGVTIPTAIPSSGPTGVTGASTILSSETTG